MAAAVFDYCVITASTPTQAELYRSLVQRRKDAGIYPSALHFRFYSDPQNGRVGSGGGTLVALNELYKEEKSKPAIDAGGLDEAGVRAFFSEKRVLILHAGGESRRLPCYVPEGKLFGPLSMLSHSSATHSPVVLDLVLSLYSKYPWVKGEVIMASGDVIADFDVGVLKQTNKPFVRGAICGFGMAASLEQGSRHGVFAFSKEDNGEAATITVSDFHQKSPVDVLQNECLIPGTTNQCALDMGIFTMNADWTLAFFQLAAAVFPEEGISVMQAVDASKLYFDFYLEVVIASLPSQSREQYLARVGSSSKLPESVLNLCFAHLGGDKLELRGALAADAVFLHFGTLREFPQASVDAGVHSMEPFYMLQHRLESSPVQVSADADSGKAGSIHSSIKGGDGILFTNCDVPTLQVKRAESGDASADLVWVEMCEHVKVTLSRAGFHMLIGLRGVKLPVDLTIPAGICFDARHIDRLAGGAQIVAVYAVDDSFKKVKSADRVVFCGTPMPQWLSDRGLIAENVWAAEDAAEANDLWSAKLFCRCEGEGAGARLPGYWDSSAFSKEAFLQTERFSIGDLNTADSALKRDETRTAHFIAMAGSR